MQDVWYNHVSGFVDETDIDEYKSFAYTVLIDPLFRATDFTAMKNLFRRALRHSLTLTAKQELALQYEQEALQHNVHERDISKYVAERLGNHHDNARRLLNRAHMRETLIYYTKNVVKASNNITINKDIKMYHKPTRDLDKILFQTWVDCPTLPYYDGCTGKARAYNGLCVECHKHFKDKRKYPDGVPQWVDAIRISVRDEHRLQLQENYGTVNADLSNYVI